MIGIYSLTSGITVLTMSTELKEIQEKYNSYPEADRGFLTIKEKVSEDGLVGEWQDVNPIYEA